MAPGATAGQRGRGRGLAAALALAAACRLLGGPLAFLAAGSGALAPRPLRRAAGSCRLSRAAVAEQVVAKPGAEPVAEGSVQRRRKEWKPFQPRIPIDSLKVGQSFRGLALATGRFGAIVDIGAESNGLLHISAVAKERFEQLKGKRVKVWISGLDDGKLRLTTFKNQLDINDMKKYPIPYDSLKVGQEFKGIVRSMSQFGAFVDIGAKNPGLLHRSSVTANEINNTRWLLKANQEVKVWISGLTGDGQFSLTMIEGQKDIRVRTLKYGQEFQGTVHSVTDIGAFVDIGADNKGLLHISAISKDPVEDIHSVLKEGQEVKVWVSNLRDDGRFLLTMTDKKTPPIPFDSLKVGQEFQGTVRRVGKDYSFVDIGATVVGLLHKSAISTDSIEDISSVLQEGQEVKVWISGLNREGKLHLTMVEGQLDTPRIQFGWLEVGQEFQGTVRSVQDFGAFVDIGATSDGLLHKSAISTDRIEDIHSVLKDGQEVKVWISGLRGDGKVYLTMVEGKKDKNIPPIPFDSLRVGQEFWGTVNSLRRHGAYVDIGAEREGLLHISAISKDYIEKTSSVSVLKGDKMVKVWISDLSDDGKFGLTMIKGYKRPERVERESPKSLRKVAPFSRASPDEWFEGRVLRLLPFGVFILLKAEDGTEAAGLCHVSQVARAVSVGQKVKVRVLGVDVGAEKMSLSMLKSGGFESVSPDKWLTGKVVRCETFGAFVEVTAPNGATADGLVHISQIKDDFVRNVKKEFEPGQEVKVRVINVDVVAGKMILSMKPPESSD